MKKILIALAFIATNLSIYAQEPMGGGGFGGGRPPMGNFNGMDDEDDQATEVVKFPEIPKLTDKQREKVIDIVVKEHDATAKLEKEKRAIFMKQGFPGQKGQRPQGGSGGQPGDSLQGKRPEGPAPENAPSGQQANNQRPEDPQMGGQHPGSRPALSAKDEKKVKKLDEKLAKVHANADKKYRSVLSSAQYSIFAEKKNEITFNDSNKSNTHKGNRPQRPNGNGGGAHPDMPMGGGGGF